MFDGLEVRNGATNVGRIDTGEHAGADSRQHVLDVVRALQRDFSDTGMMACSLLRIAPDDAVAANECTVLDLALTAEPVHGGLGFVGHRNAGGVVGVQNREVGGGLVLEDASLGCGVVFERMVAVEMIGRDVQHYGDLGAKGLDGLQLKAADLEDNPGIVGRSSRRN